MDTQESSEVFVFERTIDNTGPDINPAQTVVPKSRSNIATHLDLCTFFHICQKTKTNFLCLDWQPSLDLLGRGGSGEVNQSYQNLQFSYAFKRLRVLEMPSASTTEAFYEVLVTEVAILQHPVLKLHPNIVDLLGVTWDVIVDPPGQVELFRVHPVFVFEKATHGSLSRYIEVSRDSSELCFENRLRVCIDIGSAIETLHAQGE